MKKDHTDNPKNTPKKKPHIILRILGGLLLVVVTVVALAFAGLLGLTALEYHPRDTEPAEMTDAANLSGMRELKTGESIRVVTWNTGYGALGDNADFFMDGGHMVYTADRERVEKNLNAIRNELDKLQPDILFLQELDRNSARSYGIDEREWLLGSGLSFLNKSQTAFACNMKVAFVPYPIPPIGKVTGGIFTSSVFPIAEATRIQLPCPFTWPVRIANLKRCLLVCRIPVEGTGHELVLVNLHLEAYDSGEGKIAQTAQLVEVLKNEQQKGNYVLAGGDFNQTFPSVDGSAYPTLPDTWSCGVLDETAFGDAFSFYMDNQAPSCRALDRAIADVAEKDPAHFQYYLIDGFIASDNLSVESIHTEDLGFAASDHNPVVLQVTLKE